jgi:hypothetical protein
MPALEGKADIPDLPSNVPSDPKRTWPDEINDRPTLVLVSFRRALEQVLRRRTGNASNLTAHAFDQHVHQDIGIGNATGANHLNQLAAKRDF